MFLKNLIINLLIINYLNNYFLSIFEKYILIILFIFNIKFILKIKSILAF